MQKDKRPWQFAFAQLLAPSPTSFPASSWRPPSGHLPRCWSQSKSFAARPRWSYLEKNPYHGWVMLWKLMAQSGMKVITFDCLVDLREFIHGSQITMAAKCHPTHKTYLKQKASKNNIYTFIYLSVALFLWDAKSSMGMQCSWVSHHMPQRLETLVVQRATKGSNLSILNL